MFRADERLGIQLSSKIPARNEMPMNPSPFHRDELDAQARAGGGASGAGIRSFMPDQHRDFFALLPYLFLATTDADGWPLATMLTGRPGFVHSPDPVTLRVDALPDRQDPAAIAFKAAQEVGLLGIDLSTRRRNRANGQMADLDAAGFTVVVRQSFGNCAKYIHRRNVRHAPQAQGGVVALAGLDAEARALIARADTLFVASRSRPEIGAAGGIDISHRGGRPGFVQVEGDSLAIPDFPGNRYYNTLGNLLGEPRAALLFVDFETGDLLQLQGTAKIDWSTKAVEGAERLWHFEAMRGWRRRAASSLRWSFVDDASAMLKTGSRSR
jgi:predicted pyridoxine 5'-phosphate oxidase superfamily flavin-nucleotide-binding protein